MFYIITYLLVLCRLSVDGHFKLITVATSFLKSVHEKACCPLKMNRLVAELKKVDRFIFIY